MAARGPRLGEDLERAADAGRPGVSVQRKGKTRRRLVQMELAMDWVREGTVLYEYAVLVTAMNDDRFTLARRYRDRGGVENNFDEWKNQRGWLGLTTPDHAPVESQQARRGDYVASAPAAGHRAQDNAQPSVQLDAGQPARRGQQDPGRDEGGGPVPAGMSKSA